MIVRNLYTQIRYIALILIMLLSQSLSAKPLQRYLDEMRAIPQSGLLSQRSEGRKNIAIRSKLPLIPASTVKLATAYLALKYWESGYRFKTEFYRKGDTLWIRGKGDPSITSEEIVLMGQFLQDSADLSSIKKIALDHSYIPDVRLDGRGKSQNPYDAGNGALIVNFNTVYVERDDTGLHPGETQTPLTPLARKLSRVNHGRHRFALPGGAAQSAQYFGEVFSQLVFAKQLPISRGKVPASLNPVYIHENSQNLQHVVRVMLKYSNNLIANQLFLLMGATMSELGSLVVSEDNSIAYYQKKLSEDFSWKNFRLVDGAGLSRKNRLSAAQLLNLVDALRPWRDLLPEVADRVQAKTGTMHKISALAGFYEDDHGAWQSFALLINHHDVNFDYRFRLAKALTH